MSNIKYIGIVILVAFSTVIKAQSINYFFVDDVYQRSYINPALNDEKLVSLASGFGISATTNGPGLGDLLIDNANGGKTISAASAIEGMNDLNEINGYSSVNTFDASINIPTLFRVSIGHAWKANGWMEYPKNLAELITFGNGGFVGETMNLGPQIDYINYNEIYLGLQKSFGTLSVGAKVKYISGVESIITGNNQIDLTTSGDIYQLTLQSDFELSTSQAFSYVDIDDFSTDIENFSFENFLSGNSGLAFDIGASFSVGDRLELSASLLDIGSITWDVNPKTYTSNKTQTFDGIDVADYISNDTEFVLTDSLESLLKLTETNGSFKTTLPSQFYLGGRFKISELWTVGAIIQTLGSGDRRSNVIGLNATANIYKWLAVGAIYSAKSGNPANIGLNTAVRLGPIVGFLSTDNVLNIGSYKSTNSNIRAGLSFRI